MTLWLKWSSILSSILSVLLACCFFYFLIVYVGSSYQIKQFDRTLRRDYPIFQMIADSNPIQYQRFLLHVRDNVKSNFGDMQLEALSFELMNEVYPQYLAKAPNNSIFADLEATLDLYKKIIDDSPALLLKLEFPERFPQVNLDRLKNPYYTQLLQHSREVKSELVAAAIADPQSTPTADEVDSEIARIIARLIGEHGETLVAQTFSGTDDSTLNKKLAATVIIDFYQALLAQMPQGAGRIVRYFSSETLRDNEASS